MLMGDNINCNQAAKLPSHQRLMSFCPLSNSEEQQDRLILNHLMA